MQPNRVSYTDAVLLLDLTFEFASNYDQDLVLFKDFSSLLK